jgi:OmpA-OmpF porin, OOP family
MPSARHTIAIAGLLVIGGALVPPDAEAQIGQRLRDRARQQVEQRAEERADQALDRGLDAVEDAVVCAVTDRECMRDAREAGHEVVVTDAAGAPLPRDQYPAETLGPGEGAWLNYDFVPGELAIWE